MKNLLEKILRYILSKIENKTIEEIIETPIQETIQEVEQEVLEDVEEIVDPEELLKKLLLTSIDILDNFNINQNTKLKIELQNILERI